MMRKICLCFFLLLLSFSTLVFSQALKSPEDTFGFKMGSDRKLINWDQITGYFESLNQHSPRVRVTELGKTTLGRPMIMAIIGSESVMANLDQYQDIQKQLARPYDLEAAGADNLISTGKIVVIITLNIHSTEIAASQESVELAYELATSTTPQVKKILDNVIVLLVPSLNPDGQDMITKWYLQDVGTEYEGSRMPKKYHHYADHDNNRDWFFFNLVESQHVGKVLYHDWYPEIVMDQHQMGSGAARFFLPPYADPVNPNVAPSLMANVNMLGKHVVSDLHDQGFTGLVTGTIFNAFFEGTMSKTPLWHNRIGILTEAASVRVASPIFFPRSSLRGMGIDLPEYVQQTNFLSPWPGGWWRLRDIIEYEKAATYAILDLAATYKDKFKANFYRLNKEAIKKGRHEAPFAYVIPAEQHDPNNAVELLRRVRFANVDIFRADADFKTDARQFHKGDFIIPLAQPARAYIKDLMEIQQYPNLREYPGGPPRQPYDVTAWTLPLQFDITALEIAEPLEAAMSMVAAPKIKYEKTAPALDWIAVERRFSHSYKLINQLLSEGIDVYEKSKTDSILTAGTFVMKSSDANSEKIQSLAERHQVQLKSVHDIGPAEKIENARIAIYQPWIPWAYDEGWLRLVLDNFGFEYAIVNNKDFKSGSFKSKFDVLIFGSQSPSWIVEGKSKNHKEPILGEPKIREEYTRGIAEDGVNKISQFLQDGGVVLFFGEAVDFAIEHLNLPAENTLQDSKREDYFAPGSLFRMVLDPTSRLRYGMKNSVPIYKNRAIALRLKPYHHKIGETGFLGNKDLLESGWAVGEEKLNNRVVLAEIPVGKGKVVLYAFRPQHRGQTYGTFKLIFNALYQNPSS